MPKILFRFYFKHSHVQYIKKNAVLITSVYTPCRAMKLHVKYFIAHLLMQNSMFQYGETGLIQASRLGFIDTVQVLLEAKADPNITNDVRLHYSHCLYNNNLMPYNRMVRLPSIGPP